MRKQSYKTFLINEIQRLTDNDSRSISKWADCSGERAKAAIVAYMLEEETYSLNSSNQTLKDISTEAFKIKLGKDSEYKKDAQRYKVFYKHYLERLGYKEELMNKKINRSDLYKACKEYGFNYGNAFNFFINKKSSYLTEEKAQKILLFKK